MGGVVVALGTITLPAWSQSSSSSQTLEVPATSEIHLAAPGAEHAEALDPSVVDARVVSPETVGIRGVRPGKTAVLIVTRDALLTWQVHVTPPPVVSPDPVGAQGGTLEFSYTPTALPDSNGLAGSCAAPPGSAPSIFPACPPSTTPASGGFWTLSFESNGWTGTAGSGGWRLNVPAHDVGIAAASYLPTPLDQFSGTSSWGVSARTTSGLQIIGTPQGTQVYQHIKASPADLYAGITPFGPLVGARADSGGVAVAATALDAGGQIETAATLSLRTGDVTLSYSDGPAGNSIVGQLSRAPFSLSLGTGSGGPQAAVSYDLGSGRTIQAWWSNQNSFIVMLVSPFDSGVANMTATPARTQIAASITFPDGAAPATVPLGAGSLTLTPPPSGSSVPFFQIRWPLPAATPPPAEHVPGAPIKPTAVLLVRACVHPNPADTTCHPADSPLTISLQVDGSPALSSPGVAIPLAPGQHRIEISPADVPPLLVPLRGLSCDVTVSAFSTGTCDFPFRHAGAP